MDEQDRWPVWIVEEVNNYGGFFGGETVTFSAVARADPNRRQEFTVDDFAFENLRERHKIVPGIALALLIKDDKVEKARVIGAREREDLRAALTESEHVPAAIRVFAYWCPHDRLWVAGQPLEPQPPTGQYVCRLCGNTLNRTEPGAPFDRQMYQP